MNELKYEHEIPYTDDMEVGKANNMLEFKYSGCLHENYSAVKSIWCYNEKDFNEILYYFSECLSVIGGSFIKR